MGCQAGQSLERPGNTLLRTEDQVAVVLLQKAERLHILEQAQLFEALEHRPVIDDCARRIDDVRLTLEERYLDGSPGETERTEQADRTCSHD